MRTRFYPVIFSLTLILTLTFTRQSEAQDALYNLFWSRAWPELEAKFTSLKKKTTRDYVLMANAYRLQERWSDVVSILESQAKNLPQNVKPYADMTLLLGYEKLKRTRDAIRLSESLYTSAPQDLKYYVALAQYRLYDSQKDSRNTKNALTRMLASANTDERRIYTLKLLLPLESGNDAVSHATRLLELEPGNKEAASILANIKNMSPEMLTAMGVHMYTIGNNSQALTYLNRTQTRKALYYRAWSNSKLKQNDTALNIWGGLALSGNEYAVNSVARIANLAKTQSMRSKCVNALERVARERRGNVQARALQALVSLQGKGEAKRKTELEAQLLRSHPNSNAAFNVLWARAWRYINSRNYAEAAKLLSFADAPGTGSHRRARILYWLAYSQRQAGMREASENTTALLRRKYPTTIYGQLSNPNIKLINGTNPNLTLRPSELEQYGFIYHAYLKLSQPRAKARELYRALILSQWLGLTETYTDALKLERLLAGNTTLYRTDLEALYPRPYRAMVDAASKRYGVESSFIWAIMRQESAFKADARSWAGASGLMQLMPGTAKDESRRAGLSSYNLLNPNDNIRLGTSHLAWLSKSFARKEYVMAAYNAGSGNARKWLRDGGDRLDLAHWIERITFEETSGYVQRVSGNLEMYRMLYDAKR